MRFLVLVLLIGIGIGACSLEAPVTEPSIEPTIDGMPVALPAPAVGRWHVISSGEGTSLFFDEGEGRRTVYLSCPSGEDRLVVNVASFTPVASEERMTFGAGDVVAILVADPAGDRLRGGISGEGAVPRELAAILTSNEGFRVNYGSQNSPPLPAIGASQGRAFLSGCAG